MEFYGSADGFGVINNDKRKEINESMSLSQNTTDRERSVPRSLSLRSAGSVAAESDAKNADDER